MNHRQKIAQKLQNTGIALLLSLVVFMAISSGAIDISLPVAPAANDISYAYVRANVFVPRCIPCHGAAGDVNFETYATATANPQRLRKSVFELHRMPPSAALPLSRKQKAILRSWLDAGMPDTPGSRR
jgi:hypothetical protein